MTMTDNPASVIDEGTYTVRRTIRIAAPVDAVWRAVTEPEHISKWFGRTVLDGTGPGAQGTFGIQRLIVHGNDQHRQGRLFGLELLD